jgi:flagellar hook-associated protein 3 FlgL
MMVAGAIRRLNDRLVQFDAAQRQLATGKRLFQGSDDVAGMEQALRLRADLALRRQEQRNADDGTAFVEMADARLDSLTTELQRARELAVLGATGTANPAEQEAMAAEIDSILLSAVGTANARHQGRALFAGFAGGDAVAQVAGAWTYLGDDGAVYRRVSDTEMVAVNVTGDDLFGFAAGSDVFTTLESLGAALGAGDRATIEASITALDGALGRVGTARATIGAAANRLESARFRSQAQQVTLSTQLSTIEDADMASAIMELQMQEVAYQAAQGALARALQPSLTSFLR